MCLTLSQVTKRYDDRTVLDAVSFDVNAGERVALLGHNGAGKSTLMKIILGLIPANEGTVSVLGHAPGSIIAKTGTAYLPENAAFHPALTGQEQLCHYLRLRGEPTKHATPLLERVGLGPAAKRRIGTYSKGMRQRVGLAQALIGKPRLLVLDEPTSGLDPVSRREFYVILDELAAQGTAILLSSHALTEVEARTDRIVILSSGVMVANDTLANLRRRASLPIRLQVSATTGNADEVASKLSGDRRNGVMVDLVCNSEEKLARLGDISALGSLVEDVDVIPPSLEDIYSHFSKGGGA
ncbi:MULTISPECIES: ABC transporter ATP-binding protein [Thalassospira]|uniref:ABC transporter ATP-binding protein n=2 Tax=Thalassospira TaxID=168934 RepID=A0A367W892_9PROT|nr:MULTISPECIES: ABC transporter ATP-binding protein [Thalassospira]MDG4720422.1 ABC transporter ATP-binding protein [Thalassospira sp. FZY0004]RCK37597.1 ABC transporter ATP-binding protein [Thalassospira profundimaris]